MRILKQAEQFPERCGALSEDDKAELLRQLHEDGGFTFRDRPGDGPSDGFMVSLPDAEEVSATDSFTGDDIGDYHDRQRPLLDENTDNHHGGWNDGGEVYQDVSRHYDDLWDAVLQGYGQNEDEAQHGIYHIPSNTTFSPLELSYNGEPGFVMARRAS